MFSFQPTLNSPTDRAGEPEKVSCLLGRWCGSHPQFSQLQQHLFFLRRSTPPTQPMAGRWIQDQVTPGVTSSPQLEPSRRQGRHG